MGSVGVAVCGSLNHQLPLFGSFWVKVSGRLMAGHGTSGAGRESMGGLMKLARGGSEAKSFRIMGSPTLHSPPELESYSTECHPRRKIFCPKRRAGCEGARTRGRRGEKETRERERGGARAIEQLLTMQEPDGSRPRQSQSGSTARRTEFAGRHKRDDCPDLRGVLVIEIQSSGVDL